MKMKFFTEIYIEVPDRFNNDLVKTLKYVDKELRSALHVDSLNVDDSRLSVEEVLVLDYEMLDSELQGIGQ